ncbi:MAG: tRNA pseudouridine(55) synthase TruB [Holosporales bacterium]|jgi:tRNA pseudouridine55 synthase|nr:tRNA pseudouridine(55) synthase TruB [Holosporales bacterium]
MDASGWLVVDKPSGMTSTKVGAIVKRLFKVNKIGHVGTLDPLATGVLILAIGYATRLINIFEQSSNYKKYEFSVVFGASTDTFDSDGTIVSECNVFPTRDDIERVCAALVGEQLQTPPQYSAIKIDGRRLCDWARKGIQKDAKARPINIFSLNLLRYVNEKEATFSIECTAGTYVRSVAVEIARQLDTLCFVTALRRTKDRIFELEQSCPLDFLGKIAYKERECWPFLPMDFVLGDIPVVSLSDEEWEDVKHGRPICVPDCGFDAAACMRYSGTLVGLCHVSQGQCFPKKVFSVF